MGSRRGGVILRKEAGIISICRPSQPCGHETSNFLSVFLGSGHDGIFSDWMLFSVCCVLLVGVCACLTVPGSGYKARETKIVIFEVVHFIQAVVDICCWVDMTS